MKKSILFVISVVVMSAFVLGACGSSANNDTLPVSDSDSDSEYSDYVGTQFSGQDPWGGNLSITVRSITNGEMNWTFTDTFDDHTLYQEQNKTTIQDGKAEYSIEGEDTEDENISFSYQGNIELSDGQITFSFLKGAVTTSSTEGDSDSHVAEALSDSGISNEVVLTASTAQ